MSANEKPLWQPSDEQIQATNMWALMQGASEYTDQPLTTYSSFYRWSVENSEKFLVVERVALGEGKRGGVMLQLSISLATYFEAPEDVKRANETERRVGRTKRARRG